MANRTCDRFSTRRSALGVAFAAALFLLPAPSRACQYCRQGEDPEAYRFMNEGRISGGFPVDAGLGQYAADPGAGPADGKNANPPPAAVPPAVPASALPAASLAQTPVAVPASPPVEVPVTVAAVAPVAPAATARWADLGLLGLLGLGGWFGWRTRQVRQRQTLA